MFFIDARVMILDIVFGNIRHIVLNRFFCNTFWLVGIYMRFGYGWIVLITMASRNTLAVVFKRISRNTLNVVLK